MATSRRLLTVEDIHGAWAIMATPARAGASDWRETDTVDLDETARAIEGLIAAGIDGILSLGTLGECSTLTWDEKRRFIATCVETVAGRVPFFAGTTTLNTRETVRQTREAYDIGADGTMLGLPMWCPADVPTAVQFYRDVAEACPDGAICMYANPHAFRFAFPSEFWAQVCDIPQVVAAKHGNFAQLAADLDASRRRIRLMPIDIAYANAAQMDPEFVTGFWTSNAVCGPLVSTRQRDEVARAKATGDWTRAKELGDAVGKAMAPLIPNHDFGIFATHNIGLEKEKINAAGWMNAGPCRPPNHLTPEEYLEGARTSGRMWAALEQKLRSEPAQAA
jgi:trans-o-hydroxybenzylidenepyruvate hydratase-aldolase